MGSSTEMEFGTPASIEEAEARLDEIDHEKDELKQRKAENMEEQRLLREEYTEESRKRSSWGHGAVSVVAEDVGDVADDAATFADAHGRKKLAKDLEPLEEERAAIEEQLLVLEREEMELEHWIDEQEALENAKSEEEKAQDRHLDELESLHEDDIITEEEYEVGVERVQDKYEEEEEEDNEE